MSGSPDPVRVLTLADDRYAMPLAVMGRSLFETHTSGRRLILEIVDGGISEGNRARIERSWDGACRGPVAWKWVAPSFGNARSLPVWGRMPVLTYARLFLDSYFEGAGRVIVLDSDTLVLADVAPLHDTGLEGKAVGACVDPFIPTVSSFDGLPPLARKGLSPETPYFNAGVMTVDLQRWREFEVAARALEYIEREYRSLRQYDQDALNAVLVGQWKALDPEWHVHPRTPHALGIPIPPGARIAHFSGRLKPWLYDGGTALDRSFLACVERTDWRGFQPPRTWLPRLWKLYDSPARRWMYAMESRVLAWKRMAELGVPFLRGPDAERREVEE